MEHLWRPRNETQEDLLTEQAAADHIEKAFQCRITKLSETLYHIDWALSREGSVKAFGEFKRRHNSVSRYDTLLLSAAKFRQGVDLGAFYRVPFILFIQWDEGIFFCNCDEVSTRELHIGGNSRGQNGDLEPCVEIPTYLFKSI